MRIYRQLHNNKVIPKQHILEQHCLPFITAYKNGLGLLGEQGGELIHSTIAKIEKRVACIRQENRRMKTVMECHLIQVAPYLPCYMRPIKRRKLSK